VLSATLCYVPGLDRLAPDAVVNLAGENILNPLRRMTAGFEREVVQSRVDTTLLLARAITAAQKRPSVFIATSAVGIYEPDPRVEYDENSQLRPPANGDGRDFPRHLCHQIEAAARLPADFSVQPQTETFMPQGSGRLELNAPSNAERLPRVVLVRNGVVLGRGGGMMSMIQMPFSLGVGGTIGSGAQHIPWIHLRDAAAVYVHALEHPELEGALNAVAPEIVTNKELTKTLGAVLHRPTLLSTPAFSIRLVFGEKRAVMLLEGQRVRPTRLLASGFHFHFPSLRDALVDLCA